MRLTLLNPPHTAIGSRIPGEQLPPFGLLCIGGPLIDAGHQVRLVNADPGPMEMARIVVECLYDRPDAVLIGHSGSSSAHPPVVGIARLVRYHGVELINLAEENPTSSRRAWKAFLQALIAEDVKVTIIGSTRADDIVRDADILHLYKKAGVLRFLLGMEGTDEATLKAIKKGGSRSKDREAIRLLRQNGMIGLCTFAVGFEDETDCDYWRMLRQLLAYDPDQVMSIYATPHRWTPFHGQSASRRVIQPDLRLWDYKHQVLETPRVPAWRVFLWVKTIEAALQLRPKALWRSYLHPDAKLRHAMRWYSRLGRRVVLHEVLSFLLRERRRAGPTVAEFWGGAQLDEKALSRSGRSGKRTGRKVMGGASAPAYLR